MAYTRPTPAGRAAAPAKRSRQPVRDRMIHHRNSSPKVIMSTARVAILRSWNERLGWKRIQATTADARSTIRAAGHQRTPFLGGRVRFGSDIVGAHYKPADRPWRNS